MTMKICPNIFTFHCLNLMQKPSSSVEMSSFLPMVGQKWKSLTSTLMDLGKCSWFP